MNTLQLLTLKDKRFIQLTVLLLLASATYSQIKNTQTANIIITFTDIRSDVGNIAMGLYDAEDQWTDNPRYNFWWDKSKMQNGKLEVKIDSLPRKKYACAVLDDEDKSFKMNFFLGLPKEGWGMSTNPPFLKLIKPGFEEVSFELDSPNLWIEIKMNYLNKNKKVK